LRNFFKNFTIDFLAKINIASNRWSRRLFLLNCDICKLSHELDVRRSDWLPQQ
jgi:hypothetical protein